MADGMSDKSYERLSQCKEDLIRLFNEVSKTQDIIVSCGYRNQKDQDAAFAGGASKLKYPNSAHNTNPSKAADVYAADYPFVADVGESEKGLSKRQKENALAFRKLVEDTAKQLNIQLYPVISWDLPHCQLA